MVGPFRNRDSLISLRAEEYDLVAHFDVGVANVHDNLVHGDLSRQRESVASD